MFAVTMLVAPPVVPIVISPLLLLHVPAAVVELNEVVKPTQTASTPVIGFGLGFTVTTAVAIHASVAVNVIVVVPDAIPVTSPVPSTVP